MRNYFDQFAAPTPPTVNIAEADGWAVGTDGIQWILRRRGGVDRRSGRTVWADLSFVRSTKDILERCMREKNCPSATCESLLGALGSEFEEKSDPQQAERDKRASQDLPHTIRDKEVQCSQAAFDHQTQGSVRTGRSYHDRSG
jgi:hypothetical protein